MSRKCGFHHIYRMNGVFQLRRYDGLIIEESPRYNYLYRIKKHLDSIFPRPDDSCVISAPIVGSFGGF